MTNWANSDTLRPEVEYGLEYIWKVLVGKDEWCSNMATACGHSYFWIPASVDTQAYAIIFLLVWVGVINPQYSNWRGGCLSSVMTQFSVFHCDHKLTSVLEWLMVVVVVGWWWDDENNGFAFEYIYLKAFLKSFW